MSTNADSPSLPISRARVVYGKRPNRFSIPIDEHPLSIDDDAAPQPSTRLSQRRQSPSAHASESELSPSPFQFSFRHRLKQLDQEFEERDMRPARPDQSPSMAAVLARPSQVKVPQIVPMATTFLPSEARHAPGSVSLASLPSSPVSLHATLFQEHPPVSPIRTRAVSTPVPADSEAEQSTKSSSVSPVRHAITTPHSRSSPTPPTSGEIPMPSKKAKGKAPARDVLPLLFDDERPLTAVRPVKPRKARPKERAAHPKTKAPTKKEQREAALESSRIAANRPVEVVRTQERKRTLASFLQNAFGRDQPVAPSTGTELPSDPIERFSSPADKSARALPRNSIFGSPTGLLRSSARPRRSDGPSYSTVLPPAANDSDDEMPPVTSLIRKESGKRGRLQAIKQTALQLADTRHTADTNSDDDDLLVVKDDMHAVAREEAAQRRLDKVLGSPVKDLATLRRINHPGVRPVAVSPQKLSKQEWQELAKPSFARQGNGSKGQLTKKQLDQLMKMQYTKVQLKTIKEQEENFVNGGGKLSRDICDDSQLSLSQKLRAYAEQALIAMEAGGVVENEDSADEDDEDYVPDLRGSASPEPMDGDEDEDEDGLDDDMKISQALRPQEDDEEEVAPLRRNKSGQRCARVIGSDDEEEQPVHCNLPKTQRNSVSSMESQTEDENDKENSAKLMYDRSEDKENKAVVRHERSTSLGTRLGSLHGSKDGATPAASATSFNDDATSTPKGDIRSPLKDISKDEDDLFLSSPPRNSSFTANLLRSAAISPPRTSTSTLSLGSPPILQSERVRRLNRLSLDSENDENDPSGFKLQQPSFLERLHSQISLDPSLAPIKPVADGGFSQLFSAEEQSSTKGIGGAGNGELSLTLDVGLKPALEVSSTLRQKAESIFEKEQDYVVAAAVQQNDRPEELLYVNDHGFLTQTRPEGSSPQLYHMTPSQASRFIGAQIHSTQTEPLSDRPPLRTLSFSLSSTQQPLKRLRRCSASPSEQKSLERNKPVSKLNAFSILGKAPEPPAEVEKTKLGNSEFVAVEAEESDEDDMFGFGGRKKDDDDEEDDGGEDKVVEGLVDDVVMDTETEALDLVLEKHREYEEEDDQRLQKLHQDAVEGKFRVKRRGREFGFEEDSDDDDDDEARRIRQRIYKKRKIEGDSLEALGQNDETRAFYNTYHQDLIDRDDEFGHLREDVAMPVDDEDAKAEEPEEQETVDVDVVRHLVREVAQNNIVLQPMDPEDTSWVDESTVMEHDDAVRIKVVNHRQTRSTTRANAGQVNFDIERSTRHEEEQERKQLTAWAKNQSHRHLGTGRAGSSTAITGHTRVKAGGGSLRSAQSSTAATASGARKTVTKAPSLLSAVSNRRDKFM